MKTYTEMIESIISRSNEIIDRKRKHNEIIEVVGLLIACVLLIFFFVTLKSCANAAARVVCKTSGEDIQLYIYYTALP